MAEWSACLLTDHEVVGLIPISAIIFPRFLSTRPRHYSIPLNAAGRFLLSGRVVSVATLPVMVSRLG